MGMGSGGIGTTTFGTSGNYHAFPLHITLPATGAAVTGLVGRVDGTSDAVLPAMVVGITSVHKVKATVAPGLPLLVPSMLTKHSKYITLDQHLPEVVMNASAMRQLVGQVAVTNSGMVTDTNGLRKIVGQPVALVNSSLQIANATLFRKWKRSLVLTIPAATFDALAGKKRVVNAIDRIMAPMVAAVSAKKTSKGTDGEPSTPPVTATVSGAVYRLVIGTIATTTPGAELAGVVAPPVYTYTGDVVTVLGVLGASVHVDVTPVEEAAAAPVLPVVGVAVLARRVVVGVAAVTNPATAPNIANFTRKPGTVLVYLPGWGATTAGVVQRAPVAVQAVNPVATVAVAAEVTHVHRAVVVAGVPTPVPVGDALRKVTGDTVAVLGPLEILTTAKGLHKLVLSVALPPVQAPSSASALSDLDNVSYRVVGRRYTEGSAFQTIALQAIRRPVER